MDYDVQALNEFRREAAVTFPHLMKWAMAGALAVGTLLGGIAGLVTGWLAARGKTR